MHLDFIVERVPTNERAAASKRRAPASRSVNPPPPSSLPFARLSSTHCTHIRAETPPDRKYRLRSQRGFLIQTSPEVAAPSPSLSLCLFFFCCFFSGSVGFNQLPPHVLATRAHTKTCTPTPPLSSSLEESKAFGQLTKALCGCTHFRKIGSLSVCVSEMSSRSFGDH